MDGASGEQALLLAWQAGEPRAGDALFQRVHHELRGIAAALLRYERGSSLSVGDLVGEAVVRLVQAEGITFRDRAHFLALASRVMRRVLIDQARARETGKRAHDRVTMVTGLDRDEVPLDLLGLNEALIELERLDPARAAIVEMRYFGGMSLQDIASVTGTSLATVKRRWQSTRLWLFDALKE